MANLIPMEQAAKMLGMSTEQITELRSKNEIFGYRDGSSWKFKLEELQRVASDRGIKLGRPEASDFELSNEAINDAMKSGVGGSSSDIVIDEDSDDALSFGSSDIALAAEGSDVLGDVEGKTGESASDTGKLNGDDLQMAEDDLFDNDLSISDSASFEDSAELSSDFEDSDMVLDDSDSSNEVALEANDSGIDLKPTDSGISLEEPLELGGSDIDSLELPEDDEILSLEDSADPSAATMLGGEDDFNLTPLDDALDDPSSGSQVIALEDSEVFADDSAATLLSDSHADVAHPMMEGAPQQQMHPVGMVAVDTGTVVMLPEHNYSIWNILSLMLVCILVLIGGMVAMDIARNIWQVDGTISDSILSFFIGLSGMQP